VTRFFDILLAGFALLVLSPLLLVVMLVLRCTGEHDVFYRQARIGRAGRSFGLLKFATMRRDSPNIGSGLITTRNDPRVLPVGRILRKTKINELPQIFNVMTGDMSIVGPRPQVKAHFDVYPEHVRNEIVRVQPGLTGIGSIIFRDEEAILSASSLPLDVCYGQLIAPYKGELELWYLRRGSRGDYFRVIFLTAWVILFHHSRLYEIVFSDLPVPPPGLFPRSEGSAGARVVGR
jgi:lipopolysaccharide/colanic/teichoic acid biosynthesis glycosyltransferase